MWRRWKAGQSLRGIGRAFGKSHVSIHFLLSHHGRIVSATRRRSLLTLTLAEREDISRGIACGSSTREIAKRLDRAASTVSRARATLVGARTALVNAARGLAKSYGERLRKCGMQQVSKGLAAGLSAELRAALEPRKEIVI